MSRARDNAKRVHPGIDIIEVSCTTGQGIDEWLGWIEKRLDAVRKNAPTPKT
jgi:hydrogenase nickel incorporation protein HypB